MLSFSSKLPRFLRNFKFWTNLAENSNSSVFKTISGFCSSHQMDTKKTFQISIINDNFSLGSILGPEVIVGTLSLGSKKLKISKYSILGENSEECFLYLLWTLYGIIFFKIIPQTNLFMIQVDFKPLPRFQVRSIQALPNSIKPFLIFRVLFPNSPNIHRKYIQDILNPINISLSLTMHFPIDSSPCFFKENKVFFKENFV